MGFPADGRSTHAKYASDASSTITSLSLPKTQYCKYYGQCASMLEMAASDYMYYLILLIHLATFFPTIIYSSPTPAISSWHWSRPSSKQHMSISRNCHNEGNYSFLLIKSGSYWYIVILNSLTMVYIVLRNPTFRRCIRS